MRQEVRKRLIRKRNHGMPARVPKATSKREGAHSGERETAQAVVGSVVQAASQRRRAQKGVAATARQGQAAVLSHVAKAGKVAPAVQKEVARAMKSEDLT